MPVVTCPTCRAKFTSTGARGVCCPTCGARVGGSAAGGSSYRPVAAAAPAGRPVRRPRDDEDDGYDRPVRRKRANDGSKMVLYVLLGGGTLALLGGFGVCLVGAFFAAQAEDQEAEVARIEDRRPANFGGPLPPVIGVDFGGMNPGGAPGQPPGMGMPPMPAMPQMPQPGAFPNPPGGQPPFGGPPGFPQPGGQPPGFQFPAMPQPPAMPQLPNIPQPPFGGPQGMRPPFGPQGPGARPPFGPQGPGQGPGARPPFGGPQNRPPPGGPGQPPFGLPGPGVQPPGFPQPGVPQQEGPFGLRPPGPQPTTPQPFDQPFGGPQQPPAAGAAVVSLTNLRRKKVGGRDGLEVDFEYADGGRPDSLDMLRVTAAGGTAGVLYNGLSGSRGTIRVESVRGQRPLTGRVEVWIERRTSPLPGAAVGPTVSNVLTLD